MSRPVCVVLDIENDEQIEVRNLALAPVVMLRTYGEERITADLRLSPVEALRLARALTLAAEHAVEAAAAAAAPVIADSAAMPRLTGWARDQIVGID